jgi:hypothetical protein
MAAAETMIADKAIPTSVGANLNTEVKAHSEATTVCAGGETCTEVEKVHVGEDGEEKIIEWNSSFVMKTLSNMVKDVTSEEYILSEMMKVVHDTVTVSIIRPSLEAFSKVNGDEGISSVIEDLQKALLASGFDTPQDVISKIADDVIVKASEEYTKSFITKATSESLPEDAGDVFLKVGTIVRAVKEVFDDDVRRTIEMFGKCVFRKHTPLGKLWAPSSRSGHMPPPPPSFQTYQSVWDLVIEEARSVMEYSMTRLVKDAIHYAMMECDMETLSSSLKKNIMEGIGQYGGNKFGRENSKFQNDVSGTYTFSMSILNDNKIGEECKPPERNVKEKRPWTLKATVHDDHTGGEMMKDVEVSVEYADEEHHNSSTFQKAFFFKYDPMRILG